VVGVSQQQQRRKAKKKKKISGAEVHTGGRIGL